MRERLQACWAGGIALALLPIQGSFGGPVHAQATGSITGQVVFATTGEAVHGAVVRIARLGRSTVTDEHGRYEISDLPPGTYQVLAQREHFTAEEQRVEVRSEEVAEAYFALRLAAVHEHVTVTASPTGEITTFQAFNSVTVLDAFDLAKNMAGTLGEVLENEPGIARRSFGPGSSRPILRGFDGDRVLIMQDGIRTGDLSSQSGDHGVSLDPSSLERVEVVKGPATLLYGSNAIGGVVNAITPHESLRQSPMQGTLGQFTTDGGTANAQAGANASVQHTQGSWTLWAGGGGRRTGDYDTPIGEIENSRTRLATGRGGVGYRGERASFSLGYQMEDGRYGIPFAGEFDQHGPHGDGHDDEEELLVSLDNRRQSLRIDVGLHELQSRYLDSVRLTTNYLNWRHDEIEVEDGLEEVGTSFRNENVVFRADVQQQKAGRLSGRFGFWGQTRDYEAVGLEALAPPTSQSTQAAFAYHELDFGRYRLQFGGRVERNAYRPDERPQEADRDDGDDPGELDAPDVRSRNFLGVSASAGVHVDFGANSAFVVNVSRSHRAPSLEELYNFGPHVGNLAFEIGNPDLERESIFGLDASLRHRAPGLRGEFNVYRYGIDQFVFPALAGFEEDGLRVVNFLQGDSRFIGFDAKGNVRLHEGIWLNVGAGYVNAGLTAPGEPLPRIPPVHGRVALELPYGGISIMPELVWAGRQSRVHGDETTTPGYAVLNLQASHTRAAGHLAHMFSVRAYNVTNQLYRHHTSFIKDLAPELGRGVKVTYSVRFF